MVEVLADFEELEAAIDVLSEVDIVDLIDVTLVHVSLEEALEDMLWCVDAKAVKHAEELGLGHVTVLGDVEVLEDWLQVDAHGLHSLAILVKDIIDLVTGSWVGAQILSPGEEGIVLGDWGDHSRWRLVNSSRRESLVNAGDEVGVSEEALWVVGLVLVSQALKLIVGEGEVERAEDGFELRAGDSALAELVEVSEELLDTNSLHDDASADSVLNIGGIV